MTESDLVDMTVDYEAESTVERLACSKDDESVALMEI